MLSETNERGWSVYLHTVPKEITRYPYDKYYVGITKAKKVTHRWGANGNGYKGQVFFMLLRNMDGIIYGMRFF